jgi:hypothetical protein
MPTYRNQTKHRITFPDKSYLSWQPGETRALAYFVPHDELGLTLIAPEPYVLRDRPRGFDYNEMIISPEMTPEERIWKLPYYETVEISVYVLEGYVRMYVGDSEDPIMIDANNNHVSHYAWDMSAYLTFESDQDVAVYMKCEPFTFKGARKEMM